MRHPKSALGFVALVSSVPLLAGCGSTDAKKLAAERVGDLTHVLATRSRPDADRISACGNGAPTVTGASALRRRPFLQQVTATSALVVFRSAQADVTADVTRADGSAVGSVAAVKDASVSAGDGSWQGIARVDGLEPSTLYCYSLRGLTQPAGFRTAPAPGSDETVRFVVFGDSGDGSDTQYAVRDQMLTVPFDLMLHTGDVAYEHGTAGELDGTFFAVYASLLAEFPIYPIAGNHDHETGDGSPFREAFVLPENGAPNGVETWYSFDWGDVHFVALDTEKTGPVQAAWLDRDLASTDKPWKVVFAHKPPFSSGEHGSDAGFQSYFVPPIKKYGVQLVLSGHDHDYERSKPISGTTYVVTGGGGKSTRSVGASDFTAFSVDVLHFTDVEVGKDDLTLHAIDGTGLEFDSDVIPRAL